MLLAVSWSGANLGTTQGLDTEGNICMLRGGHKQADDGGHDTKKDDLLSCACLILSDFMMRRWCVGGVQVTDGSGGLILVGRNRRCPIIFMFVWTDIIGLYTVNVKLWDQWLFFFFVDASKQARRCCFNTLLC